MSDKEYSRELTDKQFRQTIKSIISVINDDTLSAQEKLNGVIQYTDSKIGEDMLQEESEAVSELFWEYGELEPVHIKLYKSA